MDKLIQGDALAELRKLPSDSAKIVVTSPPYNLRATRGATAKGSSWSSSSLFNSGYDAHDDKMNVGEYVAWQRECLTEMLRIVTDDGAVFYNHKPRIQDGLVDTRHEIVKDFPLRQVIIWSRGSGFNWNAGYFVPSHEYIFMFVKSNKFRLAKGANALTDVWRIPFERNNPHPAPFPLALAERCIGSVADPGVVVDPFSGSGTTLVAARMAGLDFVGIDKSADYVAMAKRRLDDFGVNLRGMCARMERKEALDREQLEWAIKLFKPLPVSP